TRLCPLGDLDLQLVGIDEIVRRDAEAAGGHLLDGALPRIAVRQGNEAGFVFPALARIRPATDAVHRDRECLVRLLLMEPNDMAPVAKRFTISEAGSTSSIGRGLAAVFRFIKPRRVQRFLLCSLSSCEYSSNVAKLFCRTACCSLLTVSGLYKWYSPLTLY